MADVTNISGIYCIKNIINNKIYIGKTKNFKKRIIVHLSELNKNIHHSFHLQRAYNKYGKESFECIILKKVHDLNDLGYYENMYINHYNSSNRVFGYNISGTDEQKINMSLAAKKRVLKYRDNHLKMKLAALEVQKKKVYQFGLNGQFIKEYNSIVQAAKETGAETSAITKCCRLKQKSCVGFWFSYKKEFIKQKRYNGMKINVFNKLDNIIKEYDCISLFCKENNVSDPSIINGVIRNWGGRYKNFLITKI